MRVDDSYLAELPHDELVGRLEQIANEVNVKDSVHEVMASIVAAVVKHTPWTLCWVAMIDLDKRRIVHDYHAGAFDPEYAFTLHEWDLEGTVTLDAAISGEVIAIGDVRRSGYSYLHDASVSAGVVATLYLAVPFDLEGHSVVLNVALPYAHEFSAAEISLARGISTFAAIAFRNVLATDRAVQMQAREKGRLAQLNSTILEKNATLEEIALAQSRLLRLQTVGADVSALCAEIAGLVDLPLLLLDPFSQHLGLVGMAVPDADLISAHLASSGYRGLERLDPRPAIVAVGGSRFVVINVVEDNSLIARIVLQLTGDEPPPQTAMRILELARVHVSLMVMRYRAEFETEARFAREFVDALVTGSSSVTISQHAGLLGLPLQSTSQVLLARMTGWVGTPRRRLDELVQFVSSRLRHNGVSLVAAPAGDSDIMIMLTNVSAWPSERVTHLLRRAIGDGVRLLGESADRLTVAIGIGGGFSGIEGLRRSHREASRALQITLSSGHSDGDLSFEDAGTYAILASTPDEERRHFLQRYLNPLTDYDRMHGGSFLPTLSMYFECIGNVPRTAERLFLHVSTVRYRLRRIEELTGMSFDDEEDRLRMQLCLRFARIVEPSEL